jgi:multidrug resistance efflux pump
MQQLSICSNSNEPEATFSIIFRLLRQAARAGIIQELNLRHRSQVVRLGEVLAQIAPNQLPLQIKAQAAAQHIGKVEVGQTVQMQVSACPYPDYGTLKGVVQTILDCELRVSSCLHSWALCFIAPQ